MLQRNNSKHLAYRCIYSESTMPARNWRIGINAGLRECLRPDTLQRGGEKLTTCSGRRKTYVAPLGLLSYFQSFPALTSQCGRRQSALMPACLRQVLCRVACSKTDAVLAGLVSVASCATGICTGWRCGKATMYGIGFIGGEISHGLLIQRKFIQLFFHLWMTSWFAWSGFRASGCRRIICRVDRDHWPIFCPPKPATMIPATTCNWHSSAV